MKNNIRIGLRFSGDESSASIYTLELKINYSL